MLPPKKDSAHYHLRLPRGEQAMDLPAPHCVDGWLQGWAQCAGSCPPCRRLIFNDRTFPAPTCLPELIRAGRVAHAIVLRILLREIFPCCTGSGTSAASLERAWCCRLTVDELDMAWPIRLSPCWEGRGPAEAPGMLRHREGGCRQILDELGPTAPEPPHRVCIERPDRRPQSHMAAGGWGALAAAPKRHPSALRT